jgi:hypothetical protein
MRCSKSLLMALIACGSGVAMAGPLDRNAASKATGDMVGQAPIERASRAFSYSPAPVVVAPQTAQAIPAPPVQAVPAQAAPVQAMQAQAAPVRRYSYQPAPRYYGAQQAAQPGYLRVDKKILGY